MKSYNHLWEKYLTVENYQEAVKNATRHKGGKKKKNKRARYYRAHMDEKQAELMAYAEHFRSEKHKPVLIYDGIRRKQRYIVVPSMREQIVHHMVINVLKPIMMKGMYEHSFGSVPGRGAHLGKKQIEKWIRTGGRDVKYCLKMDIRKYFDSVPHALLKARMAAVIHDERFLQVLREIVDAAPGDRGMPIGFYTSQWFANWYLTGLDHWIKEEMRAKHYARYMDDMIIFGGNKRELHRMRAAIAEYLQMRLGLEMKGNWQVFRFDYIRKDGTHGGRDLDFMGFRFFRDRTILRKTLMIRMTRKARRISRKKTKTVYDCRQMLSYLGWIDCTDVYAMYRKRIKPHVNFQQMKRRESAYTRAQNRREKKHEQMVQMRERGQRAAGGTGHHQQQKVELCPERLPEDRGPGEGRADLSGALGMDGDEGGEGDLGDLPAGRNQRREHRLPGHDGGH